MKPIKITVTGTEACVTEKPVPTSGMVGLPVEFTFDKAWDHLAKTAVFRAGSCSVPIACVQDAAEVPWEVMVKPGVGLYIGVFGTDGEGSEQIPTIWALVDTIRPGTQIPDTVPEEPTPQIYDQILAAANEAVKTANSVRNDANNGMFEGPPGRDPIKGEDYWTPEDKQKIVEEAVELFPVYEGETEVAENPNTSRYQYAKKANITNGQFWLLSSGNLVKYAYENYSTLEPLVLPAGQYYLSAVSAPYSFVVGSDGTISKIADFEPGASVDTGGFVLTLAETTTLYLGYYTPTQVTATTPYVVSGSQPLADGEYFEGEEPPISLETLFNYGTFVESYIKNCELVANKLDVEGDTQGHYTGVKMDAHIEKIMCKARFVENASVALITTDRGSSVVTDITGGSIHLVFSLDGCAVGIFDTAGNLRNVTHYSYTVSANAEVSFGFAVNETTNTLTVYLPDGTTQTVTDSDVSVRNGQYAIWEHFCNTSVAGFAFCKMTKLWCKDADGNVLDDNLKRLDGAIGVAPTGQTYRQFTTQNLYNRDFA